LFNNDKQLGQLKLNFKERKSMPNLDLDVNGNIRIKGLKTILYQIKGVIDQKLKN